MSQRQEVEASAYEKSATHRGALRKDLSLKGPVRAETSTERKSIVHEQRPKPYWLIVNYEVSRMDVLTAHLVRSEEALPVFSFEEEAGMFFEHRALGTQWQVRETSAGELVSVLFGPCASAERVALDPLSDVGVEALSYLASMRRNDFLMFLMVKQKLWLSRKERGLDRMVPITRSSKSPLSKQTSGRLSSTRAPRKTSKWEIAGP